MAIGFAVVVVVFVEIVVDVGEVCIPGFGIGTCRRTTCSPTIATFNAGRLDADDTDDTDGGIGVVGVDTVDEEAAEVDGFDGSVILEESMVGEPEES